MHDQNMSSCVGYGALLKITNMKDTNCLGQLPTFKLNLMIDE